MVVCIFPSIGGTENQGASDGTLKHKNVWGAEIHGISSDAKIGLTENKNVKVNAAASLKAIKANSKKYKYKKVKAKKVSKYKKVKAASKYKVKVRYKYKGKWRTKWVYRYYTPVKQVVSATNVGAYNVVVTSEYVYAIGRCSCSLYTDYNYHIRVFYNYNPATNRWGTLNFEQGPAPKTSPEGLWYDTVTDMDFCLVHGKSHDNRNVFLMPYNGVINGINVINGYFTDIAVNPPATNSTNTTDSTNSTNGDMTSTNSTNITDATNSTNGTNVNG